MTDFERCPKPIRYTDMTEKERIKVADKVAVSNWLEEQNKGAPLKRKEVKLSYWERCPKCGALGKIDDDQRAGRVSIHCECGNHYFKERKT